MKISILRLALPAAMIALPWALPPVMALAAAAAPVAVAASDASAVTLEPAKPHPVPSEVPGSATLLVHTMPSSKGRQVRATTLLFVPRGAPPAGGWPVVAWAHGTTTPGLPSCAPSLSPELDGGLTRDGFTSRYAWQIGELVRSGFAVVAPDYEGLGPVASKPYPYYGEASLARSLIAGLRAARLAEPTLSSRYAVFGHSDGGHAALSVEAHASETPELTLVGTVASAPYASVAAIVAEKARVASAGDGKTASDAFLQQQFNVALMTVGLMAEDPSFDANAVMGPDLVAALPAFRRQCSVKAIGVLSTAIGARGARFRGARTDWAAQPRMAAFLHANDPAVEPGFTLSHPTLIVQGDADRSVLEPLSSAFAARLRASDAPVTYRSYAGADHFTILPRSDADVIAFLKARFAAQASGDGK